MRTSSVRKANPDEKAVRVAVLECLIIASFFVLSNLDIGLESLEGAAAILFLAYAVSISICNGIVTGFMAETKQLAGWRWGVMASGLTLLMMIVMVTIPTMWSGLAIVIAPLLAIAILFVTMNASEKKP